MTPEQSELAKAIHTIALSFDFHPKDCACSMHQLINAARRTEQSERERDELKHARIYTRCPSCHNDTLTINNGHLLCTWFECKDPTAIDQSEQELSQLRADLKVCAEALRNSDGMLAQRGVGIIIKTRADNRKALSLPSVQAALKKE